MLGNDLFHHLGLFCGDHNTLTVENYLIHLEIVGQSWTVEILRDSGN